MTTKEKSESAMSQVSKIVDKKIDHVSGGLHSTANKIIDVVGAAADRAVASTHTAFETLETSADKLNELQAHTVESLRSSTRSSPIMALSLATVVGFVCGRFLKFGYNNTVRK